MGGVLLFLAVASGAPAVELAFPAGPRTVKIDLFAAEPQLHPWGSDWKPAGLEQWTAVLSCAREGRSERCRFVDGVWWSVVLGGDSVRTSVHLPAPGELEFVWTARGRLQAWDVMGDRSAFWTEASNAQLKHTFHRADMVFKPAAQQEIGVRIEQVLARGLASALEWEMPKSGDTQAPWSPSQAPLATRQWTQSTSSADLTLAAAGQDAAGVQLTMTGDVQERFSDGSLLQYAVETEVRGTATFDPRAGVTRARVETRSVPSASSTISGYLRFLVLVEPWAEGGSTLPADPPEFTLP